MVVNNGNLRLDRLPNEIFEEIILIALSSSGYSWSDYGCHVYNRLCEVNTRFHEITSALSSVLPRIYFSSDSEAGTIIVRSLIKKFRSSRGLVLQVRQIVSDPQWANAWLRLQYVGFG